jgi:hypothetical protein
MGTLPRERWVPRETSYPQTGLKVFTRSRRAAVGES